jgi:CBS domain-containing protein
MWERDCGSVPVVDAEGKPIAMITDRDICMAAYTQGQPLANIPVSSAASHALVAVREDDSLDVAEALMQKNKIRRIPVINKSGRLAGILSMNDLARQAQTKGFPRGDSLSPESIVQTLAAVSQPTAQAAAAE